jgi:sec-independent protein translocase protein TatB
MFGLTFDKLALIAIIAVFLVGPERLPLYAGRLAELIRSLRDLTDTAKTRLKQELGPEVEDIDWKKLDPRQYDPRRIIREALAEDVTEAAATAPSAADVEFGLGGAAAPGLAPAPRMKAGSDGRYRPVLPASEPVPVATATERVPVAAASAPDQNGQSF